MNKRYYLIDAMRGLSMISMVAFHFCYDVFMIRGRDVLWYHRPWARAWQLSICCSFILISGFVWRLSGSRRIQNSIKRGLFVSLMGLLVTVLTAVFMPSELIIFGVLTFIGAAMLVTAPLDLLFGRLFQEEKPANKSNFICIVLTMLMLVLFFLTYRTGDGLIGLKATGYLRLPAFLFRSYLIGVPLGLPPSGFYSSDYFPMLPWYFLYLAGYFLSGQRPTEAIGRMGETKIPFLSALGRYAIPVYILHQPIAMGLAMLFF